MSLEDWKRAKRRLEGLYPDSAQRGLVTSRLRDLSLDERLEYCKGDDDYVRAGLLKFTRTIQGKAFLPSWPSLPAYKTEQCFPDSQDQRV